MFFEAKLRVVISPRFTTRTPRFYHQKTTPKHALFAKPPSKSPAKQHKKASTRPPVIFGKLWLFSNSFHSNRIGRIAGGKHSEEGRQRRARSPNHRNIPGMSVSSKQKMLIVRERKCARSRHRVTADRLHSSVIDAVQRNRVRAEVGDP